MKKAMILLGVLSSIGLAACAPSENGERAESTAVETGTGVILEGDVNATDDSVEENAETDGEVPAGDVDTSAEEETTEAEQDSVEAEEAADEDKSAIQ